MAVEILDCDIDNLVCEYLAGASARNLESKFGISRDIIVRRLKKRGIHIRSKAEQGQMGLAANSEEMTRLYQSGEPMANIAQKFDCTETTVFNILRAKGVKPRRSAHIPEASIVIADYVSGMTGPQIAEKYGIGPSSVHRILKANNIEANSYSPEIDLDRAKELFQNGIGIGGIVKHVGGSTTYLKNIFAKNGIKTRNRSEQQLARMGRTTAEERRALAKAAHDAIRGKKVSHQSLINRSNARCKTVSKYERQLMDMLTERGITTEPQLPIGPYNCDLASGSVAVEVFGGGFHWYGKHLASVEERFRYILNAGWNLLVVPVNAWGCELDSVVADYVAAYIKKANSDPSGRREYRVIWRSGECFTTGSLDDDHISIVPPFTNRRNPANGRYETIPR